jgi:deubiquitinase DESI2
MYLFSDLHDSNSWLNGVGLGVYHTGVEISGFEYTFSNNGILKCTPLNAPPPARFRETIVLGIHSGSANEISQLIRELRSVFAEGTYDLITKNCNTFSNEFCLRTIGVEIPKWVNRLAGIGGWMSSIGLPMTQQIENGNADAQGAEDTSKSQKKQLTEQQKNLLNKFKTKDSNVK